MALKPTINGIRSHTMLRGTPMNSGVIIRLAPIITTAIAAVPHINAITAPFLVLLNLYMTPATITSTLVAIMCIIIP